MDDAFQHRYVKAGLSVLLVDYNRIITEDKLLPYGDLRELLAKKSLDIIVVTKCPMILVRLSKNTTKKIISQTISVFVFFDIYISKTVSCI